MTKREFVISRMKDGWTPTKKEGVVSYYGSRWDVKESTVLTDVFLPEDYGGAGQLTVQAPLNDLVAAVRYADSPERESLTEYDCNLLYNQMCLEQTVYQGRNEMDE